MNHKNAFWSLIRTLELHRVLIISPYGEVTWWILYFRKISGARGDWCRPGVREEVNRRPGRLPRQRYQSGQWEERVPQHGPPVSSSRGSRKAICWSLEYKMVAGWVGWGLLLGPCWNGGDCGHLSHQNGPQSAGHESGAQIGDYAGDSVWS